MTRIDFVDLQSDSDNSKRRSVLEGIFSSSHVLISNMFNLKSRFYFPLDHRKAACKFPYSRLRMSSPPLFVHYGVYLQKKGFRHAEAINVKVLRLMESGMRGTFGNEKGGGIFATQKEPKTCPARKSINSSSCTSFPANKQTKQVTFESDLVTQWCGDCWGSRDMP